MYTAGTYVKFIHQRMFNDYTNLADITKIICG